MSEQTCCYSCLLPCRYSCVTHSPCVFPHPSTATMVRPRLFFAAGLLVLLVTASVARAATARYAGCEGF